MLKPWSCEANQRVLKHWEDPEGSHASQWQKLVQHILHSSASRWVLSLLRGPCCSLGIDFCLLWHALMWQVATSIDLQSRIPFIFVILYSCIVTLSFTPVTWFCTATCIFVLIDQPLGTKIASGLWYLETLNSKIQSTDWLVLVCIQVLIFWDSCQEGYSDQDLLQLPSSLQMFKLTSTQLRPLQWPRCQAVYRIHSIAWQLLRWIGITAWSGFSGLVLLSLIQAGRGESYYRWSALSYKLGGIHPKNEHRMPYFRILTWRYWQSKKFQSWSTGAFGALNQSKRERWDRNACSSPPCSPELARYYEGLGQFIHPHAIHGDSSSCLDFHHLWAIFWWKLSMLSFCSSNILTLSLAWLWLVKYCKTVDHESRSSMNDVHKLKSISLNIICIMCTQVHGLASSKLWSWEWNVLSIWKRYFVVSYYLCMNTTYSILYV